MIIPYNTLVVLAGVGLLGAAAGMVGAFAVLRKRALTGDALAHAALPGLCVAFIALGTRNLPAMLIGALMSGVLGNMVIAALTRWTRIKEDAAIGTVLGGFFGLGIALSSWIQNNYPGGSKAGLDSYILGKTAGMTRSDVYLIAGAAAVCLALVLVLYKEFKLVAFDGGFARSLGWPVYRIDLMMMTLIAVAVVIGLPAVGVVLVAALLIMPGAAARFWTDRLDHLLQLAGVFGLAIGVIGTLISAHYALMPAGPIIVLTATGVFLISMLCGSRRGVIARTLRQRRFRRELAERILLRTVIELEENQTTDSIGFTRDQLLAARPLPEQEVAAALEGAVRDGSVRFVEPGRYALSASARKQAVQFERDYRLWQKLLDEHPELASSSADLGATIDSCVPPQVVVELTHQLQSEGRWPELPA